MNATKKNISIQNMLDSENDSDYNFNQRAVIGEEFVLSSAQSDAGTVMKLNSHHDSGGRPEGSGLDNINIFDMQSSDKFNSSSLNLKLSKQHNSELDMIESPTISPLKARLQPLG